MIQHDEKGNRFVVTAEGTKVPLLDAVLNVKIETALDNGVIVPVWDALAIAKTMANHWYQKYHEALTTIADLREQLQAKE